jgi:hypothetical protein
MAYSFDFECSDGENVKWYFPELEDAIFSWQQENRNGAALRLGVTETGIAVQDTRGGKKSPALPISPVELQLLRAFDTRMSIEKATGIASRELPGAPQNEILQAIEKLKTQNWILGENGIFISLVLDFPARNTLHGSYPASVRPPV